MIALNKLQKEIFENKKNRGFNTTDFGKEVVLMVEELGELARGCKKNNQPDMVDAVGDLIVYCLGLCEMLKIDSEKLLNEIVENNKIRTHSGCFKEAKNANN